METFFCIILAIFFIAFAIGSFIVCDNYKKRLKEEEEKKEEKLKRENDKLREELGLADVVAAVVSSANKKSVEEDINNEEKRIDSASNTLSGANNALSRLSELAAKGKDRLHSSTKS